MEFQPIIMAAGRGSRMTDLTTKCPKALLPVGNRPVICYPISMLERAGFEEALIIVLESQLAEIQRAVSDAGDLRLRLEYVPIPDNSNWGTADSLRHIREKVKTDLLVLSCDLITNLPLHTLADVHRTYDATVTTLLSTVPQQFADIPAPGVKTKRKTEERDFFGLEGKENRMLFLSCEADLDEIIKFRRTMLKRHPHFCVKSNLVDCHMYMMKRWVLDYLEEQKNISTVKGELIPHLVKKQFSKAQMSLDQDPTSVNQSVFSPDKTIRTDIYSFIKEDDMEKLAKEFSPWIDHSGDMADCYHGDKIRCYAYIQDGGFCVRANTLGTYCEANRQISRQLPTLFPTKDISLIHPSVVTKEKSQIGSDSVVGEGVSVGEKVSIKRSVIGRHCSIGDRVKVTNSVIMGHVTVKEGSVITGCVIGANSHINERCELKDCVLDNGQTIMAMGKFTNEAIVDLDKMMEI
ncbi:translation initiation factor eIF2B subunit gamma-like isoform X2 [Liolophura sinensis]|uniref:translation initiation factor eIF2B subunit gamma-like isoform X2 n=1 Tax=Liolophura sinensis TaxID=3198878 RepID=UPI0031585C10